MKSKTATLFPCFQIMQIQIETSVKALMGDIKMGFNESLFKKLNPPFPPVEILRFDGCKTGDRVELVLNFLLFKQRWVSDIVADREGKVEWVFIDKGTQLPFFLNKWEHRHIVKQEGNSSIVTDEIIFSTGTVITDLLIYPVLYLQFLYRRPIYQKFFNQP